MNPNKNQADFSSTAQKSIWHAFQFMSPFYEITPPGIEENLTDYFIKGERDFYDFMICFYRDMFSNPDKYYIPAVDYDLYMKGRKREELPHKNDSRECLLRNKFQHAIQFYLDFLYEIGKNGETDPASLRLIITEKTFTEVAAKLKIHKKEEDIFYYLGALKDTGLNYKKTDKSFSFFNEKFPAMFSGLSVLSKSKNRKYGYTCFLLCDYRGLSDSFTVQFEDAVWILNEKNKEIAVQVNGLMKRLNAELKIKPLRNTLLNSFWKLQYSKRGKSVCSLHIDIDRIDIYVNFNSVENISNMGYLLRKKSAELLDWFYDHFKTMNCSCKNNRNADIGGKRKRICGLMNRLEMNRPDEMDLEKIKSIVEIFHFNVLK